MLSRRGFMVSALAGLSGLLAWQLFRGSMEDAIVSMLRKRLDYLTLDDNGLNAFARDAVANGVIARPKLHLMAAAGSQYARLVSPGAGYIGHTVRHGEERIISAYLMSSDFFISGADMSRVVRYLGYYDPLRRPCGNPFARLGI